MTDSDKIKFFQEGFKIGFSKGKTRNIVTEKYYATVLNEATEEFKKTFLKQ